MEGCSVKRVTVVEGGGRGNANTRKTDNVIWDEEDDRRVVELGMWMQGSMVEDIRILRTIEDILEECEIDRCCRVVTSSRVEEGVMLRMRDGTLKISSLESTLLLTCF